MIGRVTQQSPASRDQAARLIRAYRPDWRLTAIRQLAGAMSARISAIEAAGPNGKRQLLVLRQYGPANLRSDPHSAQTEFRLLSLLCAAGLPVPRPLLADESGSIVPGPCLLQEFIDGERIDNPPDLADFAGRLAATLAAIHDVAIARADVPFLADVHDDVSRRLGTGSPRPTEVAQAKAVRATLARHWPPARRNRPVVLHGDYWPGNVLWRDNEIVGVVDWEDALFGDPLADVSIARLEIAWLHGAAAMDLLTSRYLALRPGVDVTALAVWDLRAALRACAFPLQDWGLPADQVAAMRAIHEEFAARAISRLAAAPHASARTLS